ncbi:MAG TPA: BREX-3 system phosphatase PglZ [Steroidobacteraceae bacterium]|nr:BREX-3 system phosphatase PglZ [Steroidobacteraceae bacterium]
MTTAGGMSTWRDPILAHFTKEIATVARLTIVADPDRLLTEEAILDGIRDRGFDLVPFEDHVAFRYAYETRYRQAWDRGEQTNLVVLLHTLHEDVTKLPFDLLQCARRERRLLRFSRAELFPNLSPAVLDELDSSAFDDLHHAIALNEPGVLGDNATKDFLLRHVFEISPEQIRTPADLLRVLLRRHYRAQRLPACVDARLIALLEATKRFAGWPLHTLISHREQFFAFLQERWPLFVRRQQQTGQSVAEPAEPYGLRFAGPADLPFDHEDVRVYIDSLFLEGVLAPTSVLPKESLHGSWVAVGVRGEEVEDAQVRFTRLADALERSLPDQADGHRAWTDTAWRWAEWSALRWTLGTQALKGKVDVIRSLEERVDKAFTRWMLAHYASLHNVSYLPLPVMVHHVPRYLAHGWTPASRGGKAAKRIALLVIDGLALSQWTVLRVQLSRHNHRLSEHAIFAWVPTLTSVSRQSIFAGEPPFYFSGSLGTTHKEETHWRRFWEDRGASRAEVGYICQKSQEPDEHLIDRVKDAAATPRCRVLGVVVGIVDQMMHGAVTGAEGFHAQVRHWGETGTFQRLVETLLGLGYEIVVTADHGNVEAIGFGKPNVGAVAETRGERVHVFVNDIIRAKIKAQYPNTIAWPQIALPDDYRALIAAERRAFATEGSRVVGHGGVALEELLVPFITVGSA